MKKTEIERRLIQIEGDLQIVQARLEKLEAQEEEPSGVFGVWPKIWTTDATDELRGDEDPRPEENVMVDELKGCKGGAP